MLLNTVSFLELINTSAAVDELLLTGEERVALGTDFYLDVLLGRTSFNYVAACALDGRGLVIGMDTVFHYVTAFSVFFIQRGSNPFGISRKNNYSIFAGGCQERKTVF